MTQTKLTSHAEKLPATTPWFKVTGAEIQVDQIGQQVKKTKQADGGVHIEGNPEALKKLEKVSENTNQYGLAAIKEFADALKYSADAAAAAQTHSVDTAAAAQKYSADAAAAAQQRTDDAQKFVAKSHKEEVQWLGTAGIVISVSGVAIIFMMTSVAGSFMSGVKK